MRRRVDALLDASGCSYCCWNSVSNWRKRRSVEETLWLHILCKLNNKILRILQNKHLYFPVVELYKNFNALPPLKLHEQQIFMLLHKFFHYSDKLPIVFRDYFTLNRSVFIVIVRGTVTVCMCLLCNQHLGNDQLNLKDRCCGIIYLHHWGYPYIY